MAIYLYKDPELTKRISLGDMTSPDFDSYDGVSGETKERELYLANDHSKLAAGIGSDVTGITLSSAAFADGDILIVDDEKMRLVSGGGSMSLAVERGYAGTTAAEHTAGSMIYCACDYSELVIRPFDTGGADETHWCALALTRSALDSATPGAALSVGDKPYDQTISIWRRFTVPAGTPLQNKIDIKLKITGIESLA